LEKKVAAKEIFGSNLRLASRALRGDPVFPHLSALRAAESVGKKPESQILVDIGGVEHAVGVGSGNAVFGLGHLGAEHMWKEAR
jgi:hypothetical protein